MKLVNIKKEFKPNVGPEEIPKQKDSLYGDSLNMLNNLSSSSNIDFGGNKDSVSYDNVIKNEASIVNVCLNTLIKSAMKIGIVCLISYLIIWIGKIDFELFIIKDYTSEVFFSEIRKFALIIGISLLAICILIKLSINGSIKSVFKRKYLNKVNVYIYDVFSVIVNILYYVITSSVYFYFINTYYDRLVKWQETGRVVDTVNIDILNWFKYGVVIIIAIFVAANSLKSISIIHERNEFRIEDEI